MYVFQGESRTRAKLNHKQDKLVQDLSNCGTRTTSGTPANVQW